MKMICHREPLLAAWSVVCQAVPKKTTKPVLECVLADATADGSLTLTATDLEISIFLRVDGAEIIEPGVFLIPVSRFTKILEYSRDNRIEIRTDGNLLVAGMDSPVHFEMPTSPATEFPLIHDFLKEGGEQITVSTGVLQTMIDRTKFAAHDAGGGGRFVMGGIVFQRKNGLLTLTTTNGKRLSVAGQCVHSTPSVLPKKMIELLDKHLDGLARDDEVRLSFFDNKVIVRAGGAVLQSQLMEGRYPNWTTILPKSKNASIQIAPPALLHAVRQASVMAEESYPITNFTFSKGEMKIQATSSRDGRSCVSIPIEYDGETIDVMLDPRLLVDFAKKAVSSGVGNITIELIDGLNVVVFNCGSDWKYACMPLVSSEDEE